jgi:hypothetical protein
MNEPPGLGALTDGRHPLRDREVTITHFTHDKFRANPQVGTLVKQEWRGFLRWLIWPVYASDKTAEGGWCPCALAGGVVKGGTGPTEMLVADVDECGPESYARSVRLCASGAGAVVHTFNATPEHTKHRIVMLLDRALTPEEFPIAWRKMARRLESSGVILDAGCKNINRLYFSCVARSQEAWLGATVLQGVPLPVDSMLVSARAEEAEIERQREIAREHAKAAPR